MTLHAVTLTPFAVRPALGFDTDILIDIETPPTEAELADLVINDECDIILGDEDLEYWAAAYTPTNTKPH